MTEIKAMKTESIGLDESDISRLVVARTFLTELENCVTENHYSGNHYSGDVKNISQLERNRFEKQFRFVDQLIPLAWHNAALAAEDLVPKQFQTKLADPQNSDHNRQHLAHVGNNVIVGSTYDLVLPSFSEVDLADAANVLMFGAFDHDHEQIDMHIKDGHDYLGGLFSAGLMRLARLKLGLPFTERQESLAFYSVYWHSYPEGRVEGKIMSAPQLLSKYGPDFGIDDPNSLLGWLKVELDRYGISLEALNCEIKPEDKKFADWICDRLAAGDKRASYAPSWLSVLRTMATGDKPFILNECLGKSLAYFMENIGNNDTVTRTFFEDYRDLRKVGFSAFEITWLKTNKMKKLDYLVKIAGVLTGNEKGLVVEKFQKYCLEVINESYREKSINFAVRAQLLDLLPNLLFQHDFAVLDGLPENLVATIQLIAHDCANAKQLMSKKGKELRSDLEKKGMSEEQFISWLTALVNEVKADGNSKVVGRHAPVPENMPVYCVSLGVVK